MANVFWAVASVNPVSAVMIVAIVSYLFFCNYLFELTFSSSGSTGVCPVLCSGRGDYINGQCQCNPGWKGRECSLKHDECEVPDCSGHGKCSGGKCLCGRGFKGEFCDIGKIEFNYPINVIII